MATALSHLNRLVGETEEVPGGATVAEIAAAYADWGWKADATTIDILAGVENPKDVAAATSAITALYRPWLEATAVAWQKAVGAAPVSENHSTSKPGEMEAGTCILFSDGLRFDAARSLAAEMELRGFDCETDWRLGRSLRQCLEQSSLEMRRKLAYMSRSGRSGASQWGIH